MSLFDRLKGLVIEPSTLTLPAQASDQVTFKETIRQVEKYVKSTPVPASGNGELDNTYQECNYEDVLENAIKTDPLFRDLGGFMESLSSLASILTDEATLYRAALATSKKDKNLLITSARSYIPVLEEQNAIFKEDFISNGELSIMKYQADIGMTEIEMSKLLDSLQKLEEQKEILEQRLEVKKLQLEQNQRNFDLACAKVSKRYETILTNLQKYTGA